MMMLTTATAMTKENFTSFYANVGTGIGIGIEETNRQTDRQQEQAHKNNMS